MQRQRPNAFTLIEAVVALAVASIALVALLQLQLVSMRTADKAQGLTQALLLAQQKMAEAVSNGYPPVGTTSGTVEADGDRFAWQIDVTAAPLGRPIVTSTAPRPLLSGDHLRQLTIEINWQNGPGDKHLRLTTFVAENGAREEQTRPSGIHPG